MPGSRCSRACRAYARSCAEALVLDAAVPRPGLSSLLRPRAGQEPRGFLALPAAGYEACLCSCLRGALRGEGWSSCWLSAVQGLARRGLGNPGMGSLLLLSLQAAATGYAASRGRDLVDEAVMGASRLMLEAEGVEGAARLYMGFAATAPGYLSRLSWSGLPDASRPREAVEEIRRRRVSLAEVADAAALYDPVLRDASRMLSTSLGALLGGLRERVSAGTGLAEAFKAATLEALALEGDLLLRRKLGAEPRELARRALGGSASAEAELWRLLRRAGPGSAADLAASAAARLLYLHPGPLPLLKGYPALLGGERRPVGGKG